jgi:hypothetical protein
MAGVRHLDYTCMCSYVGGAIENYSKFEVRPEIRVLQAEGLSLCEIHRRLVNVCSRGAERYSKTQRQTKHLAHIVT